MRIDFSATFHVPLLSRKVSVNSGEKFSKSFSVKRRFWHDPYRIKDQLEEDLGLARRAVESLMVRPVIPAIRICSGYPDFGRISGQDAWLKTDLRL
jgi:hypothetical protein